MSRIARPQPTGVVRARAVGPWAAAHGWRWRGPRMNIVAMARAGDFLTNGADFLFEHRARFPEERVWVGRALETLRGLQEHFFGSSLFYRRTSNEQDDALARLVVDPAARPSDARDLCAYLGWWSRRVAFLADPVWAASERLVLAALAPNAPEPVVPRARWLIPNVVEVPLERTDGAVWRPHNAATGGWWQRCLSGPLGRCALEPDTARERLAALLEGVDFAGGVDRREQRSRAQPLILESAAALAVACDRAHTFEISDALCAALREVLGGRVTSEQACLSNQMPFALFTDNEALLRAGLAAVDRIALRRAAERTGAAENGAHATGGRARRL